MRDESLEKMGLKSPDLRDLARRCFEAARASGAASKALRRELHAVLLNPAAHTENAHFAALAQRLAAHRRPPSPNIQAPTATGQIAPFRQWGADLDEESVQQMRNACSLPISVRGALMPDAHVGYGLPIGGVLATRNAVIPYAVGVDIACRMKMTVLDMPPRALLQHTDRLREAIEKQTRFGVGAHFRQHPRQHEVLDDDWSISPVTREMKDRAWEQLGTSGSGNHFVEFGLLEISDPRAGLPPGEYLALLSHSGSRGTGAAVCDYYSKAAKRRHPELPTPLRHLAWLDLDTHEGQEYWAAMNLMGRYAAANHACIHRHIAQHLGVAVLLDLENHHNFAWKERHDGEELIVHRKGATPAAAGVRGIIPGTMASPCYLVIGKGTSDSLHSAAHGAGRVMSRTQARKSLKWSEAKKVLDRAGVTLLSAGIDEVPMVYKDIDAVMRDQEDLVEPVARFHPRLVKMAPAGERPED